MANSGIVLNLKPHLKQHETYQLLDTPVYDEDGQKMTIEVFFGGGGGGGKSWILCESRLKNALRYPGYKSFIGRADLKRLKQSTYITWMKVCSFHGVPRDEWRLDPQTTAIHMRNGSIIDLLDLKYYPGEDPLYERFGSLEYSDGAIEECGEIHPLAREVLKTRIGRWMNDTYDINPSLLETGNPKKNWTYHLFYKPWKNNELPPDRFFVQSLVGDNPYVESVYARNLDRTTDPVIRARLRDGNWEYEDDPSTIMDYSAIVDLFTNAPDFDEDDEYGQDEDSYISVDVSRYGKDKTVVMFWKGWHVYKILWRVKQDTEVTSAWIDQLAREHRIPRSHIVVDEDGVGGGVVDKLRGVRGFIANLTAIETEEEDEEIIDNTPRKSRAFANLKAQCAYYAADKVNNHIASVSTDDQRIQEWLSEELEQVKEANVDGDGKRQLVPKEETKIILGRSPDFGDAFIMRSVFDLKAPSKPKETWSYRHRPQRGG